MNESFLKLDNIPVVILDYLETSDNENIIVVEYNPLLRGGLTFVKESKI